MAPAVHHVAARRAGFVSTSTVDSRASAAFFSISSSCSRFDLRCSAAGRRCFRRGERASAMALRRRRPPGVDEALQVEKVRRRGDEDEWNVRTRPDSNTLDAQQLFSPASPGSSRSAQDQVDVFLEQQLGPRRPSSASSTRSNWSDVRNAARISARWPRNHRWNRRHVRPREFRASLVLSANERGFVSGRFPSPLECEQEPRAAGRRRRTLAIRAAGATEPLRARDAGEPASAAARATPPQPWSGCPS